MDTTQSYQTSYVSNAMSRVRKSHFFLKVLFVGLFFFTHQYCHAAIAPGEIDAHQTICYGTAPATITNTISASGSGTLSFFWQQSTTAAFSGYSTIPSTNTVTYSPGILIISTWFRRGVTNGIDTEYSDPVKITVSPLTVGGTLSGGGTFCQGPGYTFLTLSGNTGSILKWQSSTTSNFSANITDIVFSLSPYPATTSIFSSLYYRAIVKSGACPPETSAISPAVIIIPQTAPGQVTGGTTVCAPTNSTKLTLTGYTGNIIKWQSSLSSNFSSTTDIANTTDSLTITNLTVKTYYRAFVQNGSCMLLFSGKDSISIAPAIAGGSLNGGNTFCTGVNSTTLTLNGYVGSISHWEWSGSSDFSSGVNNIVNTTNTYTATNLTSTRYFRAVIVNPICVSEPPVYSNIDSVVVVSQAIGGVLSGGATVCSGTNSTLLTLSAYSGSIIRWESAPDSTFSTGVVNIPNTSNTYTATNLGTTTYYRAVIQNSPCSLVISAIDSIVVITETVGGTLSAGGGVCPSPNSKLLTLTGNIGTILKWQSSTVSNFSSGVVDISNTINTYTATNLTATTYYRVVVQNAGCSILNSSTSTINVTPPVVPGILSGGNSYCVGTNNTTLTLSGYVGGIVRWESCLSADFSSGITQIANATASLNIVNLNTTTYYRVLVANSIMCPGAYSTIDSIVLYPISVGGNISGTDSVCSGANSTLLTLLGYTGSVIRWESANNAAFTGIVTQINNTTTTYTATNLSSTTYYRAVVQNGSCALAYSSVKTVVVVSPSFGGFITAPTTVCINANSTILTITSYSGTILRWESSNTSNFSGTVTTIPYTGSSYTVNNISAPTYYRAVVQNGICPYGYSQVGFINVQVQPNPGTVVGGSNVCISSNSTLLTLVGYQGNIVRWESSNTSDFSGTVTTIPNTTTTYGVNNITTTTYYRAVVQYLNCATVNSGVAGIIVETLSVGGVVSGNHDTVCVGINSTTITLSGYTGTIHWQASTSSAASGFSNINGANASTYIANNLSVKTYYRAIVTSGACAYATSSVDSVLVNAAILGNQISGGQNVCYGSTAGILTGSVPTGGNGTTYSYLWISSTVRPDSGFVTATVINTAQHYSPGILTHTTWYRRIVYSGPCSVDTSNTVSDTVNLTVAYSIPATPVSIVYGTTLVLPSTVSVKYTDSTSDMRPVVWDTTGYTGNIGTYHYSGTIVLAPGTCGSVNGALTVTVTPRIIIVKADSQIKSVGTPDPPLTYAIVSGVLVGSDTFSGFLNRVPGEGIGKYLILQHTLSLSSNYTLIYINDTLTIKPRQIDLKVSKTTITTLAYAGDSISYVITLANNGPDSMQAGQIVTIVDQPAQGLTIGSFNTSYGIYNPTNGQLILNNVFVPGGNIELTVRARVAPDYQGDSIGNIVLVELPNGITNTGEPTDTVFIPTLRLVDLSIQKLADRSITQASDTITYSIIVKNNGSAKLFTSEKIFIQEFLPDSLIQIQYTALWPLGSSYDQNSGAYTLGTELFPGDSLVLTLKGIIHGGYTQLAIVNSVKVLAPSGIFDSDSINDSAWVTTPLKQPASSSDIFASDQIICKGNSVSIGVSSVGIVNPVYTWYADSLLTNPLGHSVPLDTLLLSTTTFFITVKGDNKLENIPGAAKKITIYVHDYASDTLILTHDTTVCYGRAAILIAQPKGVVSNPVFTWYALPALNLPIATGDTFTTNKLTNDTLFYVTIKGSNLCESRELHIVRVTINKDCGNINIGLTKALSKITTETDGSYTLTFNFVTKNFGDEPLIDVKMRDDLKPVFPTALISVVSLTTPGNWNLNANYDGVNDIELLDTGNRYNVGDRQSIRLIINLIFPPLDTSTEYKNVAEIKGISIVNGKSVSRKSKDGIDPDIDSLISDTSFIPTPIVIYHNTFPNPESLEELFIPDGFSPNGDLVNDYFVIENPNQYQLYVAIYNRWGNILYESNNYDNSWDGIARKGIIIGEGVPDGTYFYLVEYIDSTGKKNKLAHALTIAR